MRKERIAASLTSWATIVILSLLSAQEIGYSQESLTVGGDLNGMVDAYLTEIAESRWRKRLEEINRISTPDDVAARQRYIRDTIIQSLGGFPEKTPLNARVVGNLERADYRVEKLIFESLPDYYVTANVYVPTTGQGPYPAVLGTAGHTRNGKAAALYQRVWISLAKKGFLVLAYDPMGQGERSEYFDTELGRSKLGGPTREHTMAGLQCLLAGSNFARYEIWDGIRALDYLLTREDVDPDRIGVAGNSGGGTQSAYLSAVEARFKAVASSCYLTSWQNLWAYPGPQDAEQVFAGFLEKGLDFGDFLTAYAPRPFLILSAVRDYFPIDGARSTFKETQRVYALLGKPEQVGFFEFDDQHGWSKPRREATYRWMDRWLKNELTEGLEPELETELEADLYCTRTGQVATSLGGETVQTLNLKMADSFYKGREALRLADDPDALRMLVADHLDVTVKIGRERSSPYYSRHGEVGRDGYRIEKLMLETEPGILVPSLLFVPATETKTKQAVLWVHPEGKAAEAGPGSDIEALVRDDCLVLAPDLRGWGESHNSQGAGGYQGVYQTTMRAILVGKTMVGMKLDDLLRSFDYLASRNDVDPERISVLGKGNGGILALYAAALEPRICKVACESAVFSYMDIIRSKFHEGMIDMVVPGIIQEFDLPDLAAAISPRTIWIVNPITPTGGRIMPAVVKGYHRDEGYVSVLDRPEDRPFQRTYAEWLELD